MITNVQLVVRELTPGTAEYDRAASVEADLETFIAEVRAAQKADPTLLGNGAGPFTREQMAIRRRLQQSSPPGRSLAAWVKERGFEFAMRGPDGRDYDVSLLQWRDSDPASTFISIRFHYVDTDKVGRKESDFFPPSNG